MIGSVAALYRYPVKSLLGEKLASAEVVARGLDGDRAWAVTDPDGKLGSGKSSRRFRRMDGLLQLAARYDAVGAPTIRFPDGTDLTGPADDLDERLSAHVGRPVRLRPEGAVSHFDDGPVHLVTTASLAALSTVAGTAVPAERARANLVLDVTGDGFVEQAWIGRELAIGRCRLRVAASMPRCVMLEMPQGDLPAAPRLLDTLERSNHLDLGVVAEVVAAGTVQVGDEVALR
ncbi:MAG TPA: MOSC N-terminal beta barrel domain-containing protein [Egicoccus sp.]|nr:MOSC N-terminal beta barrel domain-containing protein [Egicoccus sp.]HSK23193.1 MOSC N-terminal beta barrel domain-containing protein [Egicoccus sp.]